MKEGRRRRPSFLFFDREIGSDQVVDVLLEDLDDQGVLPWFFCFASQRCDALV